VVKGLVTDQFHLVRIVGGTDTWESHEAARPLDTLILLKHLARVSSAGNSVRAIVVRSRFLNHVSSRNNLYPEPQQCFANLVKVAHFIEINSQQKHQKM
jgi:hypothetical protein